MKLSKVIEKYENMEDFSYGEINICGDNYWRGYFSMRKGKKIFTKWKTLELDYKETSSLNAERFGIRENYYNLKGNKRIVVRLD